MVKLVKAKPGKTPGKTPDLSQLSSTGLEYQGGVVFDSTIRELQGPKAFKVFREMSEHSSVLGAGLFAIESLIRGISWKVEPGDDSAEEKERAEIISGMLDDMAFSWPDTIAEILSHLVYGWSYAEIVYKIRRGPDEEDSAYRSRYSDGLVGWRKWVVVPQETLCEWVWDDNGGIQGLKQFAYSAAGGSTGIRMIPIDKALLFRTKVTRNNPQGRSLLVNAYFPWQFVKKTMEVEGIGMERDLAGLPMALVPPEILSGSTPENLAALERFKDLVTGIRQNSQAGIVYPMAFDDENNPLFDFKLLATGGMRQFDTNKIIERYERRMVMALLADLVMMGHEKVGSLALSRDKTTLLGAAVGGIVDSIAAIINRHAIPPLYLMNGWGNKPERARLTPGTAANTDMKTFGALIRNLAQVGIITPDPSLEKAVRETIGLPPVDPEWQHGPRDPMPGSEAAAMDQAEDLADQGADETTEDDPESDSEGDDTGDAPAPKKKTSDWLDSIMTAAQERRDKRAGIRRPTATGVTADAVALANQRREQNQERMAKSAAKKKKEKA